MSPEVQPPPATAAEPAKPQVLHSLLAFVLLTVTLVVASALLTSIWSGLVLARKGPLPDTHPFAVREALRGVTKSLLVRAPFLAAHGFLNAFLEVTLALVPAWLSTRPWRERLRVGPSKRFPMTAWIATFLGVLMLGNLCTAVTRLGYWWNERNPLWRLNFAAVTSSPENFALLVLALAVAAGVGEELFFRGYLQTRLVERWGRWVGIGLTSLAFGALHFDWIHSTYAFAVGLLLGWAADRAGSIRPVMAVHVLNNAMALVFSREMMISRKPYAWFQVSFAVSLAVFIGCVFVLWRVSREKPAPVKPEARATSV
jgi:hypothetical protein